MAYILSTREFLTCLTRVFLNEFLVMAIVSLVNQVLMVCPDVPREDIEKDLSVTGDAQETINRIFEGNFLLGVSPTKANEALGTSSHTEQMPSVKDIFPTDEESSPVLQEAVLVDSDDSDDIELPCIPVGFQQKDSYASSSRNILNEADHLQNHTADKDQANFWRSGTLIETDFPNGSACTSADSYLTKTQRRTCDHTVSDATHSSRSLSTHSSPLELSSDHSEDEPNMMVDDNAVGRSSPMSISSDDDADDDITLSLLHRIRNKKAKENRTDLHFGRNLSNDAVEQFQGKSDRDIGDNSQNCKRPDVKKVYHSEERHKNIPVPKKYHEVSEDEDEPIVPIFKVGLPSVKTSLPEIPDSVPSLDTESCQSGSVSSYSQGSCLDSMPPQKKAKRTPEEIAAAKKRALERKAQKENEKQLKMRQQETKKQHKQQEAQAQKALREAHKAYKPEECMKYVTVVIDPFILEDSGGAALLAKLQELDSKTMIESQPIPGCITWRRQVMEHNLGNDLQLHTLHHETQECEAIIQLPTACFVDMVYTFKEEQQGTFCTEQESLRSHAQSVQEIMQGKAVTFIVQGMEKYFRLQKNAKQRTFRSAVLGNDPPDNTAKTRRKKRPIEDITTVITRVDLEEALVDLQLHVGCNVRFVETPAEVADTVATFTKSVAETPFKRERDKAMFSFHVDTEWAGGVKVSKEGRGLLKVWRQHLQQFRNVSPEIASAIVAVYPSPRLLLQGYAQCVTVQEARKLLQDIVVRRGEGVLATTRRVGPEMSRRVHTLMTCKQPDLDL